MNDQGQFGYNGSNQNFLNSVNGQPTQENHSIGNIIISTIWFMIWWEIGKFFIKKMWQHKISSLVFFSGLYGIYLVLKYVPQQDARIPIWAVIIVTVAGFLGVLRR